MPSSVNEVADEESALRLAVELLLPERNGIKLTMVWHEILFIYVYSEVVRAACEPLHCQASKS